MHVPHKESPGIKHVTDMPNTYNNANATTVYDDDDHVNSMLHRMS